MSGYMLTRRHTGWDVVLGGLVLVIGLVILGNAVVVTRISVQFLGWMLVLAGVVGLLAAALGRGSGLSRASAVGGAMALVAGLVCLRNVEAAALTLTLIIGALLLLTGVVRLFGAAATTEHRGVMLVAGLVSTVLGLVVLLNLVDASYALIGVLLGIQTVIDGITTMVAGRLTVTAAPETSTEPV